MTLVLSLELVKTYRVFFPLVDALRSFRASRGGGLYMCPPPPGRAKVAQTSPLSPLSGRLCRDVTPAARFLYPIQYNAILLKVN